MGDVETHLAALSVTATKALPSTTWAPTVQVSQSVDNLCRETIVPA